MVERGATEGEREAARKGLARTELAQASPPHAEHHGHERHGQGGHAQRRRTETVFVNYDICSWKWIGHAWVVTGLEDVLRSGRVTVKALGKPPKEVWVVNVRKFAGVWIADHSKREPKVAPPPAKPRAPTPPPPPPPPAAEPKRTGRAAKPSAPRPPAPTPEPGPIRRPDLVPHSFMACFQLEELLEELAGSEVLDETRQEMREMRVEGWKAEREYLTAAIWRAQRAVR